MADNLNKQQPAGNQPENATPPGAPKKKPFWAHPWFILGVLVFVLSVVFTLMNNLPVTVKFIGAEASISLPLLMLLCALIGAAIEFLTSLGPRILMSHENKRLKRELHDLDALVRQQKINR